MSSEYMRQLMESIEKAQDLNEGYEERVQAVADALSKEFPDGVTNQELLRKAQEVNKKYDLGASELRGNTVAGKGQKIGDSQKDFIQDLKKVYKTRRNTSAADAKRERQAKVLEQLAYIIDEAIGNAWPDGDPFDHIAPRARKMGIREMDLLDWLDRAVKKHLGGKDYHSYLKSSWASHEETMSGMPDHEPRPNPW